jgi:hypothetical protein
MTISLFPETITHELTHPITGAPTGLTLELVGQDHDDVYQAQLDVVKALRAKQIKEVTDIAVSLEFKIKVLASCIVGWTNTSEEFKAVFTKLGFTDDTFSPEKALALISMKTAGWIRNQIDSAISERQRFFKDASNS